MNTMTLEMTLPQPIYLALQSAGLNREKLRERAIRNLAIQLYTEGHLALGKAAEMAGMPPLNFWLLLVERGVPVFDYTEEDFEADVDTARRLMAQKTENK
jgi:predicted HTH domain antitoxin